MTKAKKKRIARRGSEAPPLNGLNRTKTRVILGLGVIVAVALVTVIVRDSLPTKLTDSERSLLQLYQLIRIPLTKDDLQGAKQPRLACLDSFPTIAIFPGQRDSSERVIRWKWPGTPSR